MIDNSWFHVFGGQLLSSTINGVRTSGIVSTFNPSDTHEIYRAFSMPVDKIKVVILGEEPHPNPKYATGLAYTMPERDWTPPADIQIMQKEVIRSTGAVDQSNWQQQGVMLLNTSLTVERGMPGSHVNMWRQFTNAIITTISIESPCIWFLWGERVKSYLPAIKNRKFYNEYNRETISHAPIGKDTNVILTANHPRDELTTKKGFIGCDHFYKANKILTKRRIENITW